MTCLRRPCTFRFFCDPCQSIGVTCDVLLVYRALFQRCLGTRRRTVPPAPVHAVQIIDERRVRPNFGRSFFPHKKKRRVTLLLLRKFPSRFFICACPSLLPGSTTTRSFTSEREEVICHRTIPRGKEAKKIGHFKRFRRQN